MSVMTPPVPGAQPGQPTAGAGPTPSRIRRSPPGMVLAALGLSLFGTGFVVGVPVPKLASGYRAPEEHAEPRSGRAAAPGDRHRGSRLDGQGPDGSGSRPARTPADRAQLRTSL